MSAAEGHLDERAPVSRTEAFEVLYAAIRESGPALQSWEYEALIGLVGRLAAQSPATAAGRERHGYVR